MAVHMTVPRQINHVKSSSSLHTAVKNNKHTLTFITLYHHNYGVSVYVAPKKTEEADLQKMQSAS